MRYLVAGALLGLAGSSHCAAMCGPLLLAINPTSRREACVRMLAYHAGRVLMYAMLGVLVGYAGERLIMVGIGRGLAVLTGALLLLTAAGSTVGARLGPLARAWSRVALFASGSAIAFARRHRRLGYIGLGLANGLLPCGLLYGALAVSASAGGVVRSIAFMTGFGAGTIPLLLALTISATTIPTAFRKHFRVVLPAVMALAGLLLIARGIHPINQEPVRHSPISILSRHH